MTTLPQPTPSPYRIAAEAIRDHALGVLGKAMVYASGGAAGGAAGDSRTIIGYLSASPRTVQPLGSIGLRGNSAVPARPAGLMYLLVSCSDVPEPKAGDTVRFIAADFGLQSEPPIAGGGDGLCTRTVSASGMQCVEGVYWSLEVRQ